jgi:hypothetical protein
MEEYEMKQLFWMKIIDIKILGSHAEKSIPHDIT